MNNCANQINSLVLEKSSSVSVTTIGDIIQFGISAINQGDQLIQNVIIIDNLPPQLEFVPGSVDLAGEYLADANIVEGVNIGELSPGEIKLIRFSVKVVSRSDDGVIINEAVGNFEPVTQSVQMLSTQALSTQALSTQAFNAQGLTQTTITSNSLILQIDPVMLTKSADKEVVVVGDTITYTLKVTNYANIPITQVNLQELIPNGSIFVWGSIEIDDIEQPSLDPSLGILLPDILPKGSVSVSYKVVINSNTPSIISNEALLNYQFIISPTVITMIPSPLLIQNVNVNVKLTKTASQQLVAVGEVVNYRIEVKNTGEINIDRVEVADLLDPALDFVEGSLSVDAFPRPLDSILGGITIQPLTVGELVVITFKAKVVNKITSTITNQATGVMFFTISGIEGTFSQTIESNVLILQVEKPELIITQESNQNTVTKGDHVAFKVTLRNSGETNLVNVILKGILTPGARYVPDSFFVNDRHINDVDLTKGLNLGNMDRGDKITIIYEVEIVGGNCSGKVISTVYAEYQYVLSNMKTGKGSTTSVDTLLDVNISTFKQVAYNKTFKLATCKPDIEEIDEVTAEVRFVDSYIVDTVASTSQEGQELSGRKLIVHGEIEIVVEYTADRETQSMHSARWFLPVSNFVILPIDYEEGQHVELVGIVEQVEGELSDARNIDVTMMILIIAQVS